MAIKVVLYGKGSNYQLYFNLVDREIRKGWIQVVALVLGDEKNEFMDGIPVLKSLSNLNDINYEYLIALDDDVVATKNKMKKFGIQKKIIPIRVFTVPLFDFKLYDKLLRNTPSVIARHCWGGLLYHRLGLEFNSPFVNLFLSDKDFNKLAANLKFYMKQKLVYLKDGYEKKLKKNYPIAALHDITIHFNHYENFSQAIDKWEKRKKRINWNNILFETTTESVEVAKEFDKLELEHKLCFCSKNIESQNVIDFSSYMQGKEPGTLGMLANGTATGAIPYFNELELLVNYNYEPRMKIYSKRGGACFEEIKGGLTLRKDVEMFNKYKQSDFFHLEELRFKGEDLNVNWALDDKIEAYKFVEKYKIKHPNIIAQLRDIRKLKDISMSLPNRFVLKISNRAACVGIMLLRKVAENQYFDDMSLNLYSIDEIIQTQLQIDKTKHNVLRATYWFVEEYTNNFDEYKVIPYDYKVYCICGIPKLIVQISRNINHYTVAVFDGNFMPLREGIDWFVNPDRAVVGIPVIPPSAGAILEQSVQIAKNADNKFVRIDWFDNGKEPIFGEFTFCSGLTYVYTFSLSEEIVSIFDKSLKMDCNNNYESKGYLVDSKKFYLAIEKYKNVSSLLYNELMHKCVDGNYEAMVKMEALFDDLAKNAITETEKRIYQHFAMAWGEISFQYNKLHTEKLLRRIRAGWGFVCKKTFFFDHRISEAEEALSKISLKSDWYKIRLAQFQLDFYDDIVIKGRAKDVIKKYAKEGNAYAQAVDKKYFS